ncbi:MAG: transposase [Smithella sp.]|nr:transposase [Smithella sp.]
MQKSTHSETEIYSILKEGESGVPTADLCRRYNVSNATFYRWKAKYGGMEMSDMKRLKELEGENNKLKRLIGQYAFEIEAMKELLKKNF